MNNLSKVCIIYLVRYRDRTRLEYRNRAIDEDSGAASG